MSDTETRSVAEIMGWTSTGGYGAEYWWIDADGGEHVTLGRDPSPDDMLAWLRERYVGVDIQVGASVAVEPWPGHRIVVGETLHAALEAAVRAVAEAER